MSDNLLPQESIHFLAVANARSVGKEPVIRANLALGAHIFNTNLQRHMMLRHMRRMNRLRLAILEQCVSLVLGNHTGSGEGSRQLPLVPDAMSKVIDVTSKTIQGQYQFKRP